MFFLFHDPSTSVYLFFMQMYTREYIRYFYSKECEMHLPPALCVCTIVTPLWKGKKGVQVLQCNVYLSHKSKNKGKREERRMEKKSTTVFSCIYVYRFKCTRATMCAVIYISRKSKMLLPRDNDMQVLITNCSGGCTYTKIDSRFVLFVRAFF